MSWNDERIDLLKKLWGEGLSASQIAGRLGGVSRNAVVGKVHRLGLAGRATTSRKTPTRRTYRLPTHTRAAREAGRRAIDAARERLRAMTAFAAGPGSHDDPPTVRALDVPVAERIKHADLEPHHCRWPCGDPRHPDFGFCGKRKIEGRSYCEDHLVLSVDLSRPLKRPGNPGPTFAKTHNRFETA